MNHTGGHRAFPQLAKLLISAGADVQPSNYPSRDGVPDTTNQNWLVCADPTPERLKMLQMLFDAGASPHCPGLFYSCHRPGDKSVGVDLPIHLAIRSWNTEAVRLLINAGACVDSVSAAGLRPLLIATMAGCEKSVKMLIESKASIKLADEGNKLLCYASQFGNANIIKQLLDAGVDARTSRGVACEEMCSFSHSLLYQDGEALTAILDNISSSGGAVPPTIPFTTPTPKPCVGVTTHELSWLHTVCSAKNGGAGLVEALLSHPSTAEQARKQLNAPACATGSAAMEGRTPLMLACSKGHGALVLELLAAGADANIRDPIGTYPLRALQAASKKKRNAAAERKSALDRALKALKAATTAGPNGHGPAPDSASDGESETALSRYRAHALHKGYVPAGSALLGPRHPTLDPPMSRDSPEMPSEIADALRQFYSVGGAGHLGGGGDPGECSIV